MTVAILSALSIIGLQSSVDQLLKTFTKGGIEYHLDLLETKGVRDWIFKALKPLISCIYCMSSVWGTIFYFTWSFIYGGGVLGWIPSIFAIAGTIYVLKSIGND
jgi:hypothetical protein